MSSRIAFFSSKMDVEKFFDFQTDKESIFSLHYNIAPAQHIAVVCQVNDEMVIERLRWGLSQEKGGEITSHLLDIEEALKGLNSGLYGRAVIPVSGYYKWKNTGKRSEYPFFVRMIDEPVMALAGVIQSETGESHRDQHMDQHMCAIIQSESNALVHPLDPLMPLQLDKNLAKKWLDAQSDPAEVAEEAQNLFLMPKMSVLRVSNKVNDLSENSPDLIQPLPK